MPKISTETWVVWLAGVVVATASAIFVLVTFAYGEFETKERVREMAVQNEKRDDLILDMLKRIDEKVDRVGERVTHR